MPVPSSARATCVMAAAPEGIKPEWYFLFAYELLKCLKVSGGLSGGAMGGDTYMTLFQMELSKIMAVAHMSQVFVFSTASSNTRCSSCIA